MFFGCFLSVNNVVKNVVIKVGENKNCSKKKKKKKILEFFVIYLY